MATQVVNGDIQVEGVLAQFGRYPLATLCFVGPLGADDYPTLKELLQNDLISLDVLAANIERGIDHAKATGLRPTVFNVGNWLWNGVQDPVAFWKGIAAGRRFDDPTADAKGAGYSHGLAMVQNIAQAAVELGIGSIKTPAALYNVTADPKTDESVFVRCQVRVEVVTAAAVGGGAGTTKFKQEASCGSPEMNTQQFWQQYQNTLQAVGIQEQDLLIR